MNAATSAVEFLLSAEAVRSRSRMLYVAGTDGKLRHFLVHPERLPALADYVIATIRDNYPALDVPFHARWRHFVSAGRDHWAEIDDARSWPDPAARGRAAFDLAIVSVLLDAGAGPDWRFTDPKTGLVSSRSEGLGMASLRMFERGAFSTDPDDPLRADAERLATLSADEIAEGFQASQDNPLIGLEGRAALLQKLGEAFRDSRDPVFDALERRPGVLFDLLPISVDAEEVLVSAPDILGVVLRHLGPIWPGRIALQGVALGDCWRHPLAVAADATDGFVPFHKLSQWMSYSLIEPLQWAGRRVIDIGGLTGLPEYRNGGLFLDGGVISLRDQADAAIAHEPGSMLVVEWRALTVALLDEIAAIIRRKLDMGDDVLPLAKVLEGGTWSAGRRIAREMRPGGGPPLSVLSDGTVF